MLERKTKKQLSIADDVFDGQIIDKILLDTGVIDPSFIGVLKRMDINSSLDNGDSKCSKTVYDILEDQVISSISGFRKRDIDNNYKINDGTEEDVDRCLQILEEMKEWYSRKRKLEEQFGERKSSSILIQEYIKSLSKSDYDNFINYLKGKGIEAKKHNTINLLHGSISLESVSPNDSERTFIRKAQDGTVKVAIQKCVEVCHDELIEMTFKNIPTYEGMFVYSPKGEMINGIEKKFEPYMEYPSWVRVYNTDTAEWEDKRPGKQESNTLFGRIARNIEEAYKTQRFIRGGSTVVMLARKNKKGKGRSEITEFLDL